MNHGNHGHQRGGRGGRGDRSNRKHSNSSGSSNVQQNHPTLKPSSALQGHKTPPVQFNEGAAQIGLQMSPIKENKSFTMNGYQINETYKPWPRTFMSPPGQSTPAPLNGHQINETYNPWPGTFMSPPGQSTPAPPTIRSNHHHINSGNQHKLDKSTTKKNKNHWAYLQEYKVKIMGIPESCWTKDIYDIMSSYGTVVRIDMQTGGRDNNAWVVFR